jgi:hypothetical protein
MEVKRNLIFCESKYNQTRYSVTVTEYRVWLYFDYAVSNFSLFGAAVAVWSTGSSWPDIVVALGLVCYLMRSAIHVISSARAKRLATR